MNTPRRETNPALPTIFRGGRFILSQAAVLFCLLGQCLGQGTVTITFDNPPQPPGTWSAVNQYSESGLLLTVPRGMYSLLLIGSGLAGDPDNGTTYLGTLVNTTVEVSSLSGVPFGMISFDVAQFNGLQTPWTLEAVGYRADGTTVTNDFTNAGSSFQTFHFGSGFVGLNTVDLTGGFALDNVVVAVPEPSAGGLILLGTLSTLGRSWIRRNRQPRGWLID